MQVPSEAYVTEVGHDIDGPLSLPAEGRVSDLLCMTNLAHASPTKEHDDNDDFQGTTGRAA